MVNCLNKMFHWIYKKNSKNVPVLSLWNPPNPLIGMLITCFDIQWTRVFLIRQKMSIFNAKNRHFLQDPNSFVLNTVFFYFSIFVHNPNSLYRKTDLASRQFFLFLFIISGTAPSIIAAAVGLLFFIELREMTHISNIR